MKNTCRISFRSALRAATAAVAMAAVLSGCAETKRQLGLDRKAPDEYAVVKRAPLDVPPNYTLRPPQPGAVRPQEGTTSQQARKVLLGDGRASEGVSPAEETLLKQAGAQNADPEIRAIIDRETRALVKKSERFVDRVLFWKDPEPFGTVIDPAKEAKRLEQNKQAGLPADAGEAPTIERRRGLF